MKDLCSSLEYSAWTGAIWIASKQTFWKIQARKPDFISINKKKWTYPLRGKKLDKYLDLTRD